VGCGGAGKSLFSVEMGRRLGLPVVHLDAHFWRPGWVPTPDAEWEAVHSRLVAADAWVMDGSYHRTLRSRAARADAVVFLDPPRWECFRGALARWIRLRGTVRPDTAPGCPERLDPGFLRWIGGYRRRTRPEVLAILEEFEAGGGAVAILPGRREGERFLAGLKSIT
jgi:adenylate kinase family enzyme